MRPRQTLSGSRRKPKQTENGDALGFSSPIPCMLATQICPSSMVVHRACLTESACELAFLQPSEHSQFTLDSQPALM